MNQLNRQIEETNVKKKYGGLMTEHERRVNDRDIKAYENMDTHAVNGMIPGIRQNGPTIQDKYVDKLFAA